MEEPEGAATWKGRAERAERRLEWLRQVIREAFAAPLPPGRHTSTSGAVFMSAQAALALREAAEADPPAEMRAALAEALARMPPRPAEQVAKVDAFARRLHVLMKEKGMGGE